MKKPNWIEIAQNIKIDPEHRNRVLYIARLGMKFRRRYRKVANRVNPVMPISFIAFLHCRESAFNFNSVLHNGEDLKEVNKHGTRLVPSGRGKGERWTWEDAAVDALKMKGIDKIEDWSFANCLKLAEEWNGLGYRNKVGDSGEVELSPYVTAYTNYHDETGKYVSDGKYDPKAKEGQIGCAAFMMAWEIEFQKEEYL